MYPTPHLDAAVRRQPHPMTDNSRAEEELAALKQRLAAAEAELESYRRLHDRQFYHQEDARG